MVATSSEIPWSALVGIVGILGTLASPFVTNRGLERRIQLKQKHSAATRLREARILAYKNMLAASTSCRLASFENSATAGVQQQSQEQWRRTMKAAVRDLISAFHAVDLFGSDETREAANTLLDAARAMATTNWKDDKELESLADRVGKSEDAFVRAARTDLFPDDTRRNGLLAGQ